MRVVCIEFTQDQRDQLRSLFSEFSDEISSDNPGAVLAQVFPDGMRVTCIQGDKFKSVQKALGGDASKFAATLKEASCQ